MSDLTQEFGWWKPEHSLLTPEQEDRWQQISESLKKQRPAGQTMDALMGLRGLIDLTAAHSMEERFGAVIVAAYEDGLRGGNPRDYVENSARRTAFTAGRALYLRMTKANARLREATR